MLNKILRYPFLPILLLVDKDFTNEPSALDTIIRSIR